MIKAPELLAQGDKVRVNGCIHGPRDHARNPGDTGTVQHVGSIAREPLDGEHYAIYVHFADGRHEFFYGPELDLLT